MIKLNFCLHRLPSLSSEEFHDYWRDQHGPLVAGHARVLGIRRYVQQHTVDSELSRALTASRSGPEPFDGIAEVWFDSADALGRSLEDPEAARCANDLLEDERKFIDLERSPLWLSEEVELVTP